MPIWLFRNFHHWRVVWTITLVSNRLRYFKRFDPLKRPATDSVKKNEMTEIASSKKKPSTPVALKRMSTRRIWSTLSINGSGKGGRIQWETPRQHLRQQRTCSGNRGSRLERRTQVWSLSQFYSLGLLQSWIAVKLCACANSQSRFWVTSA